MENPHAADLPLWRQRLGRAGVWVSGGAIDEDPRQFATFVERLGYTALWIGGRTDQRAGAGSALRLGAAGREQLLPLVDGDEEAVALLPGDVERD